MCMPQLSVSRLSMRSWRGYLEGHLHLVAVPPESKGRFYPTPQQAQRASASPL